MKVGAWCGLAIALLILGGCVAAKPAANPISAHEDNDDEFAVRIPDDWNGQVVMLLRGAVAHQSVSATTRSDGSAMSALLDRRYAVATPSEGTAGVATISPARERLSIHFALGFGTPTSVYLVGMSQGEYVALATIGKTSGELDRALVYAPGGFVHASVLELQDARTIELALRADEPTAELLSSRLEIDRRDLAHALHFYYALLTGVPARSVIEERKTGPFDNGGYHEERQ